MNYTASELYNKLDQKLTNLGVSPKFKENPAYQAVKDEIETMISQMNMGNDYETVMVREEEGKLSFSYTTSTYDKYELTIVCPNPETINCIRTKIKKPWRTGDGKIVNEKEAIEKEATISDKGFITIQTNISNIDDLDCENYVYNNTGSAEKKVYTDKGVMYEREYRSLDLGPLTNMNTVDVPVSSMLYYPREAFDISNIAYKMCNYREVLRRDKLDTAQLFIQKNGKITYQSIVPLSQQHGLRDMNTIGQQTTEEEVFIGPKTQEEIEEMIQKENDPVLQEGLRAFAKDRDSYSYHSELDDHYINKNNEESKTR